MLKQISINFSDFLYSGNILIFLMIFICSAVVSSKNKYKSCLGIKTFRFPAAGTLVLILLGIFITTFHIDPEKRRIYILIVYAMQFTAFIFCISGGFIESARACCPAFPFLQYKTKAINILKTRYNSEFKLRDLFFMLFLLLFGAYLIFRTFKPHLTAEMHGKLYEDGWQKPGVISLALSAAVIEEIIYRFYLQTALSRAFKSKAAGIVVTSLIWAMGHYGMSEPFLSKEFQVFYSGIILGEVRNKWGIESSIFLHLTMNLLFSIFLIMQ